MHDEAAPTRGVGRRVHALRAGRGWSLGALAARSGVGKGALVALESGGGNPTLGTLVRVADALGVSLARLVEDGPEADVRVWREAETTLLWRDPGGSSAHLLAGSDGPAVLETWRYELAEGVGRPAAEHAAGTRELVHVLSGRLLVRCGGAEVDLAAGDSARIAGDRPHRYLGGSGGGSAVLCVAVPGPGPGVA